MKNFFFYERGLTMDRVTVIDESKDILVFDFAAGVKEANALRRIMLGKIPCMAVTSVRFLVNTSVATDEFLASRIGLIPLAMDARRFDGPVYLRLKADGGDSPVVYSWQIHGGYSSVHDRIPIVRLGPRQSVSAVLTVEKGTGSEHARWQVSCPVGFRKRGDNLFRLTVESTGVYTSREILEIGLGMLDG